MNKLLLVTLLYGSTQVYAQGAKDQYTNGSHAAYLAAQPVLLDEEPPVELELLSFEAHARGTEGVLVKWATASERPHEVFLLERSLDRMTWEIILEAPGEGGSNDVTRYEVLDRKPLEGVSYYRLIQEENGEYAELSDLYSVRFDGGQALSVQADHTPGRFTVTANGHISELALVNNRGQFVPLQLDTEGELVRVHAETLANGTYYLQALVNGRQVLRPVIIDQGVIIGG